MDVVNAVVRAMSWPRAGMFWLFPTATIASAGWSCCVLRVTVSPWAFCVVRPSGIGPETPPLGVSAFSQRQPAVPAADGPINVATPSRAAPGRSRTDRSAPA